MQFGECPNKPCQPPPPHKSAAQKCSVKAHFLSANTDHTPIVTLSSGNV